MNLRLLDDLVCPLCSGSLDARRCTGQPDRRRAAHSHARGVGRMDDPGRRPSTRASRPLRRRGANLVVVRMAMEALLGVASGVRSSVPGLDAPLGAGFFEGKRVLDAGAAPVGTRTSRPRTEPAKSSRSISAWRWTPRARTCASSRMSRSFRATPAPTVPDGFRRWRVRSRLLDRRAAPSPKSVRRIQVARFGTCVPAERSRYGCTATRTTASSATWSSHFAECRPRSPLRSYAGWHGRLASPFMPPRKGCTDLFERHRQPMHCR